MTRLSFVEIDAKIKEKSSDMLSVNDISDSLFLSLTNLVYFSVLIAVHTLLIFIIN